MMTKPIKWRKNWATAYGDMDLFQKWKSNIITIDECIERLKKRNRTYISEEQFKESMKGLGWLP